jgi:hypothetical protein
MFIDAGFKGLLYTCDPPKDMSKAGCLFARSDQFSNKPDF